jgi:hypothetical protein
MNPLDKNYLSLQFKIKIYSKNGTEFQSFFENIIKKAYSDFRKIKPNGPEGDGGNDGYRKISGIYYQVYAPEEPKINLSKAGKKLKEDFEKLKNNWDNISEIKEYDFVFNDKYLGSIQKLEKVISELEKDNSGIKFHIFTTEKLEELFFSLDKADILNLGFDIDSTKAVSNAYEYLKQVEVELDRENGKFALRTLESTKDIIFDLEDDQLNLKYELLECRCLQKLEKIEKAREKYENIAKRFPDDPLAFLYLAETYLNNEDYKKNKELLDKAEEIDANHWLLKLEKLVRKDHLGEEIDTTNINEEGFPGESRIKANFYRVYAKFIEDFGNKAMADSFVEKAIHLNPDRFSNHIRKLSIFEKRIYSKQDNPNISEDLLRQLEEIEKVEEKFLTLGDIGVRNKAVLNIMKRNVFLKQEDFSTFEKIFQISRETLELTLDCYFNKQIDQIIASLLTFFLPPDENFERLLKYLEEAEKEISDELAKIIIFQFNNRNSLLKKGKKFFNRINKQKYLNFIIDIESKNDENVLKFLKNDRQFAVTIASTLKNFPSLRKKIIQNLPDDENIQKEKLLLLLNYDEENFNEAFSILKSMDLSNLSYHECIPALRIAQEKKAWDFEIIILGKLLKKEKNEENIFNLKSELFHANFNLKKYLEMIKIGEELLEEDKNENILDIKNKEALLAQTISACLERGIIDTTYFIKAKELLKTYSLAQPSFEFKISIEAQINLKNDDPQKALESIIEGAKIKKMLSLEEYARLYFLVFIQIGNLIKINLNSLKKVKKNTFVKSKNKDRWYFVGNDNELDATKISEESDMYSIFINKKIGEKISFQTKYTSESREEIIENIFPIDKYIIWQINHNFQKLSQDNALDGVETIEMPKKEETIDPKYLLDFLDDLQGKTQPFFEMYCKDKLPLAMLAVSEGGLTNAIGRIQRENKGFINFNSGTSAELENQKDIARKVIDSNLPFYIDGTSALVLSEKGLLKKVYTYLSNLKVSQSVIDLLIQVTEKFRFTPGQTGYMWNSQGKIMVSSIKKDKRDSIQSNFIKNIKLLELKIKNISTISLANKADCSSEQKIPAELCDACILAQKEGVPVLTEDFLYLKMNEIETKKKCPEYFSSLILLKVLNEQGKISFDEYLDFFAYLSSYRFRFLSLSSDDIEKAVFGDSRIKVIRTENIKKLNFSLTLSEEYGVSFQVAFALVAKFLYKVLIDDTIMPDIVEKIFLEIIESFPVKKNNNNLSQMLLKICKEAVEKNKSRLILTRINKITQEKIDRLSRVTEIFSSGIQIWTPNTK